jgi:hypothetical protein
MHGILPGHPSSSLMYSDLNISLVAWFPVCPSVIGMVQIGVLMISTAPLRLHDSKRSSPQMTHGKIGDPEAIVSREVRRDGYSLDDRKCNFLRASYAVLSTSEETMNSIWTTGLFGRYIDTMANSRRDQVSGRNGVRLVTVFMQPSTC